MKSLNLLILFILTSLFCYGCAKKQAVSEQEVVQQKYKHFVKGMKTHISEDQHKILEICSKEDGVTAEEIPFRYSEVEYLIRMRLVKINTENQKYEITALGKELLSS